MSEQSQRSEQPGPAGQPGSQGRRFYLHVGAAKSGTSYIQDVLFGSQDALRAQGVAMVPPQRHDHFPIAINLTGRARPTDGPAIKRARRTFAAAVAQHDLPVGLYTHEMMGPAPLEGIEDLVGMLEDFEVHLVVTVRDLGRTLTSSWQQNVKQRDTISLRRFLRAVAEGGKGAGFFQQGQHLVNLVERWSQVIPRERVHVVVCPAPGSPPRLLVERFCEVLGVDPGPLTFPEGMANPSLGLAQVEVLRRVNVALGDRLPGPRRGYREVGKLWLSSQVLLRQGGQRPLLPDRMRPWVEQTTQEWIDFLGRAGVDVVGDPEDLRPPESAFGVERIDEGEVTQAAIDALADILEMRHDELRTATRRSRRRRGAASVPPPGRRSLGTVLRGASRRARELSRRVSDR